MLISWIVDFRDEQKHRAEFDLVNESDVIVLARYKGYYANAAQQLEPRERWHRRFRSGDNLFLVTSFEGQEIRKQVLLFDNVADLSSPGRPAQGEILLMRVSTNEEGKVTMYTPVDSKSIGTNAGSAELHVGWHLARP